MPRLFPPRTTTRNSGSTSSMESGYVCASALTAVATSSLTQSLVARLVDRFQQVAQDGLASGHDLDGADHARNDREGLAILGQRRGLGGYPHLIVGLACILVDEAVGGDVGHLPVQTAEDRKIVGGDIYQGFLARSDEGDVAGRDASLDQESFRGRDDA